MSPSETGLQQFQRLEMDPSQILAYIMLGSVICAMLLRLYTFLAHGPLQRISSWILRHLIYPRFFPGRHLFNPARIDATLCFLHWTGTLFCNAYHIRTVTEAGRRAGQIAMVHLVPLLATPQLSICTEIFGLSIASIRVLHQAFGFMAAAQGSLHAAIAMHDNLLTTPSLIFNLISITSLGLLTVVPLSRRFAYEAFLLSHLPLSMLLGVALWVHIAHNGHFSRILLLVALGAFTAGSCYRYGRQLYHNSTFNHLSLPKIVRSAQFGDSLILEVRLSRAWTVEPGQYVYLTLLTTREFSFMQRHPFAVTWWQDVGDDESVQSISLMIDPRKGWTRRIMKHTQSLEDIKVWFDGPYGNGYRLHEFGYVLLVASGTGIFALLPLVKRMAELVKISAAKTRRIKLVWHTDEYHDQVQSWMQTLLDDEDLDIRSGPEDQAVAEFLSFTIHIPSSAEDRWRTPVQSRGRRLNIVKDMPDVGSYIRQGCLVSRRSMAVAVSAFTDLRNNVRAEVISVARDNVRLYELDYQPNRAVKHTGGSAV